MLGTIISIHEFGHFIAAKKSGVYVDEFSLGMGPLIFKHKPKNSETTYSLRLFPIGGFVSMAEKYDKTLKIKKDRVLENKDFLHRLWVLIDGIVFNFILALVLFFISGLLYGRPISSTKIVDVVENGSAQLAGIEAGDTILAVNGVKTATWDDFILEASAKKLQDNYVFKIKKANGEIREYNIVPEIKKQGKEETRVYGIIGNGVEYKKGFVEAIKYSYMGTWDNTKLYLKY